MNSLDFGVPSTDPWSVGTYVPDATPAPTTDVPSTALDASTSPAGATDWTAVYSLASLLDAHLTADSQAQAAKVAPATTGTTPQMKVGLSQNEKIMLGVGAAVLVLAFVLMRG